MSRFIKSFTNVPQTLFRLNNGPSISLRARTLKGPGIYDLLIQGDKVQPKALNPNTYEAPNGASMRPNTAFMHELVKRLRDPGVVIFVLPQGTPIPSDLILVHEFRDHYSLQAAKEMTLKDLNSKITAFLTESGERLTKEAWLERYPEQTETS